MDGGHVSRPHPEAGYRVSGSVRLSVCLSISRFPGASYQKAALAPPPSEGQTEALNAGPCGGQRLALLRCLSCLPKRKLRPVGGVRRGVPNPAALGKPPKLQAPRGAAGLHSN